MSVDTLTLTDLHLGFVLPFSLADRLETAEKSCCVLLPPSWAVEHMQSGLQITSGRRHPNQPLKLKPKPTTKACIGLLEPVCYQTCFRSFKPGLCQRTPLSSNI